MSGYEWNPDTYLDEMLAEVPGYEELQDAVAAATDDIAARDVLELGTGTGETAVRVLARHPEAHWTGIDASEAMLARAWERLPEAVLLLSRLEDPLPAGPFDLVVSTLAVHHLDGAGKRDLFVRVAAALRPGGRFVLGDVVVPRAGEDGRDRDRRGDGSAGHGRRPARVAGGGGIRRDGSRRPVRPGRVHGEARIAPTHARAVAIPARSREGHVTVHAISSEPRAEGRDPALWVGAWGRGATRGEGQTPAAVTMKSVAKPSMMPAKTSQVTSFVCPYVRLTANSSCTT